MLLIPLILQSQLEQKALQKKILYLKAPVISNIKKSQNTRYKIVWKKNKKADGYKIQISTSKKFKNNKSKIKRNFNL